MGRQKHDEKKSSLHPFREKDSHPHLCWTTPQDMWEEVETAHNAEKKYHEESKPSFSMLTIYEYAAANECRQQKQYNMWKSSLRLQRLLELCKEAKQ